MEIRSNMCYGEKDCIEMVLIPTYEEAYASAHHMGFAGMAEIAQINEMIVELINGHMRDITIRAERRPDEQR